LVRGALFGLDAGGLDDRPPFFDFGFLEGVKRLRRLLVARIDFLGEIGEPLARLRITPRCGSD
jgi:hypothetical protein